MLSPKRVRTMFCSNCSSLVARMALLYAGRPERTASGPTQVQPERAIASATAAGLTSHLMVSAGLLPAPDLAVCARGFARRPLPEDSRCSPECLGAPPGDRASALNCNKLDHSRPERNDWPRTLHGRSLYHAASAAVSETERALA